MEGVREDMWSPYKQLYNVLQNALSKTSVSNAVNLELCLKKYKQNFANFLRNPPKNEKSRIYLRTSVADGVVVMANGRKLSLSKDLVDEAFIVADMFDMDELISLELLVTAQRQMPHYPGLPRGLVAILLYYDGRKAISCTLRDLFQATAGVSWSAELPREITGLISSFTQNLVVDANILGRIIELLEDQLDILRETELLTKNRAFGPKKHQNQVLSLFEDIRLALAMSIFNWSAQRGLPKAITLRLIQYLTKYKTSEASGVIDNVALTLLMALIYAFDTSVLQRHEDNFTLVQRLPIFSDSEFVQQIYDKLMCTTGEQNIWQYKGLDSFIKFCFGLSLASLRHAPANLQMAVNPIIERDEQLIDDAIAHGVFEFMHYNLLEKELIFETEFFYRRMHMILTDFIDLMHSKVTELRGRADETSRTVMSFRNEGLEPPADLDNNFEMLMLCIGKLYKRNSCELTLCDEYWGPMESNAGATDIGGHYIKTTTRSVSLFKFIRLAGELLPKTLFVSYMTMIAGLTCSERSARNAYNLLKQTSNSQSTSQLSWDHFFASMRTYFANLRQECYLTSDTIYRNRSFNRCINPKEIECLQAVLSVIKAVAEHDEISRLIICQHPSWTPVQLLVGLLGCSVPLTLKADILFILAALARSVDSAITIWSCLEDSQIIPTLPPTANVYGQGNLIEEIEQNECRAEIYSLSRGTLQLLQSLINTYMPRNLGLGTRKAGLDPYLNFVMQTIFLKFNNRTYKIPAEKWQVGAMCIKLLYQLIANYEPNPENFIEEREQNADPGYHIMLQLHIKADVLRLILLLLEEARLLLDDFANFRGKQEVEDCALYCLLILEQGLAKQNAFFEAHSQSNSAILLSGLNRMLLDINPRSRQPDYVLNMTKFVTYNSWLPRHSLAAVKILSAVTSLPNVATQLLGMCGQSDIVKLEIRQGFVECLELDVALPASDADDENFTMCEGDGNGDIGVPIELQIKTAIIELFQSCITQPMTNIVHFFLGFERHRETASSSMSGPTTIGGTTGRQVQYVIENGVHCTKSLVYLLERSLEQQQSTAVYNAQTAHIVERVWQLLYSIYANRRTSDAILRYFRTCCNDFVLRHLAALGQYKYTFEANVLNQMSHVLKCVAIELKLVSYNCQISRFHSICEILLGNTDGQQRHQSSVPIEYANFLLQLSTRMYHNNKAAAVDHAINTPAYATQDGMHLCRLLDYVILEVEHVPLPNFDFFDGALLTQILTECEVKPYEGYKLVNIKRLHRILNDELTTVQSSIATGQRQLIVQEIRAVLLYALAVNRMRSQRYATIQYMTAWSLLTQALFTCVPDTALPLSVRKQHIIEIVERILCKIVPTQPSLEISVLCTETLLLLIAHMRYCYYQLEDEASVDNEQERLTNEREPVTSETIMNKNASKCHTAHLRYILKNVLEWIMLSDVTSQKLRINLYATLINCFRIIKRHRSVSVLSQSREMFVSLLDKTQILDPEQTTDRNQLDMAIEVVSTYGDKLIDTICHDAIMGHDICRMLALSCIDLMLELNPVPSVISFIAARGYLTNIIEGLRASDNSLCHILRENPDNMKALYTYESKMAFLLSFACSHVGAELLLSEQFLSVLSDMKVYDMQPDLKSYAQLQRQQQQQQSNNNSYWNVSNSFLPNIDERYRAILFPALDVCNCVLSVLGTDNNSVCAQVLNFIFAHGDLVESVLRAGTPYMSLGLLETLSALTNIIARTATRGIICVEDNLLDCDEPNYNRDLRNRINRIQQLMMTLFGRFVMSERTMKDMLKPDHESYDRTEQQKSLHVKYFLEVTANLVLYCHNLVTCRTSNSRTSKLLLTTIHADLSMLNIEGNNPKKLTVVLNIILNQLKGAVEYYPSQKSEADNLIQQRTSLPNISFDPNAKQRYLELTQRYNDKHNDLTLVVLIAEHSLYLLWLHLDYYLRRAVIFNLENKNALNDDNSFPLTATYDEILSLKKTLLFTFNETFCVQLLSTSELATASKGFCEALLRRIKSLIQFVPVK